MQSEKRPLIGLPVGQEFVPAQVPRRFPVGTMLLLVTMFAVVLSALRTLGVLPIWIMAAGAWVVLIALAQMILFKGKSPREASIYGGAAAWVLLGIIGTGLWAWQKAGTRGVLDGVMVVGVLVTSVGAVTVGPVLGYATGTALAGVFLIVDRIRTGRWNEVREVAIPAIVLPVSPFKSRADCPQPVLETQRLRLRPFSLADASEVQRLAGDAEVASTTARIPHPYEDGMAEAWISTHADKYHNAEEVSFAVVRKEDDQLIGAIGMRLCPDQAKAELGYWIGRPYWNQGYATEAARAVLEYGFQQLGLISIFAHHMVRNPASGRVMQKIGMQHKAKLREFIEKNGAREDCHGYEVMRHEWDAGERD